MLVMMVMVTIMTMGHSCWLINQLINQVINQVINHLINQFIKQVIWKIEAWSQFVHSIHRFIDLQSNLELIKISMT